MESHGARSRWAAEVDNTISAESTSKATKEEVARSELTHASHIGEHRLQISRCRAKATGAHIGGIGCREVEILAKACRAGVTSAPEG